MRSENITLTSEQFDHLKGIAKEGVKLKSENAHLKYANERYKEQYENMEKNFNPLLKKTQNLQITLREKEKYCEFSRSD